MALSIPQIPNNTLLPFFYGAFVPNVSAYTREMKALIIAPKTSGATATDGLPLRAEGDPRAQFGVGSIINEMIVAMRRVQPFIDIEVLPVAPSGGTAASATITVNSVPSAGGTFPIWVMGRNRRVEVTLTGAETTAQAATKIAAALNSSFTFPGSSLSLSQPFTVAASTANVTLTMRSAGTFVNGLNLISFQADQEVSGLAATCTVTQFANGAGVPDLATALAGLTKHYQTVVTAYTDDAVINAIAAWQDVQWNPINMRYGTSVFCRYGTFGTISAAGALMNKFTRVFFAKKDGAAPPWLVSAHMGGHIQGRYNLGQTIEEAQAMARAPMGWELPYAEAPYADNDYAREEQNLLLGDGVTPLKDEFDGTVTTVGRIVTTYQKSFVTGQDDTTWRDISQVMISAYVMYHFQFKVTLAHAETSLVSDERSQREGQTRPKDYRSTCFAVYQALANQGIVDDVETYRANSQFEMDSTRTRINALHAITPARPFLIAANLVQVN